MASLMCFVLKKMLGAQSASANIDPKRLIFPDEFARERSGRSVGSQLCARTGESLLRRYFSKHSSLQKYALALVLGLTFAIAQTESARAAGGVDNTVKIGNETKQTSGLLTGLQSGDVACYLTLKDGKGKEFTEMAIFEICEKTSLVGKRVRLSYRIESVMANSCQGDPECKDSRKLALVSALKVLTPTK